LLMPPPVYHLLSFLLHLLPVECYHSFLQPPATPAADASAQKSFFQLQSYQHQNIRKPQLDKNIQGNHIATWCCTFNTLAAFLTSVIHNHAFCFSMRTHVAELQCSLVTFSYHHC